MLRSELEIKLAGRFDCGIQLKDVHQSTDVILEALSTQLASGGRVEIRGFGCFTLQHKLPRVARNPKTGDKVYVEAKVVPHFKPGLGLRERVNNQVNM